MLSAGWEAISGDSVSTTKSGTPGKAGGLPYNELVHPASPMSRTTAFGTWRFASEYLQAAEVVETTAKSDMDLIAPRYYLLGHGVELALKAFPLAKDVPLAELRSKKLMGHDLEKALVRAEGLGLSDLVSLSGEERASIELLNKTYQPKEHEYITTGYVVWPSTALLFSVLNKILPAIKAMCIVSTRKEEGIE